MNFLWLIGLFYLSVQASSLRDDMLQRVVRNSDKRKYCGKYLVETLSVICRGIFNENLSYAKKDVRFDDFSNEDYAYDQQEEPSWPFISEKSATALIGPQGERGFGHRRYRRGIIDECCTKSCTRKELMSYCGNGK